MESHGGVFERKSVLVYEERDGSTTRTVGDGEALASEGGFVAIIDMDDGEVAKLIPRERVYEVDFVDE